MQSHFSLTKAFWEEKNPYNSSRSQDHPLRFLRGHGGDGALPDKIRCSNLVCGQPPVSLTKTLLEE